LRPQSRDGSSSIGCCSSSSPSESDIPPVSRFDPRTVPGCADASKYYEMVSGERAEASQQLLRPLVPWVARPIARLSAGHLPSWDPVAFGLLIASALFSATGALILLHIGRTHAGLPAATALAGALLYFLNFAVHNKHLGCGLVDSGESSVMLALYWVLFSRKLFLLPVVGLVGALAKETFIPMAAIATLGLGVRRIPASSAGAQRKGCGSSR
jgi:hypothetical protein